jgi:hypothetical protein
MTDRKFKVGQAVEYHPPQRHAVQRLNAFAKTFLPYGEATKANGVLPPRLDSPNDRAAQGGCDREVDCRLDDDVHVVSIRRGVSAGSASTVSTIQWHSSRPLPLFRCQRAISTGCRSGRAATTGQALGQLSLDWTSRVGRAARRRGQMVRWLVRSMVRNFASAANIAHLLPQLRRSVGGRGG